MYSWICQTSQLEPKSNWFSMDENCLFEWGRWYWFMDSSTERYLVTGKWRRYRLLISTRKFLTFANLSGRSIWLLSLTCKYRKGFFESPVAHCIELHTASFRTSHVFSHYMRHCGNELYRDRMSIFRNVFLSWVPVVKLWSLLVSTGIKACLFNEVVGHFVITETLTQFHWTKVLTAVGWSRNIGPRLLCCKRIPRQTRLSPVSCCLLLSCTRFL